MFRATATPPKQQRVLFPWMNEQEVRKLLDRNNPANPFHDYIGNDPAVQIALDVAMTAFKPDQAIVEKGMWFCERMVPDNILLVGPRSVGKTKFARAMSKLVGTPMAEVDATGVKRVEQIIDAIQRALQENTSPNNNPNPISLIAMKTTGHMRYYVVPPMILYLDEVHGLKGQTQDCLLKMLEGNDRILQTSTMTLDCSRMLFIMATTAMGKLKDAFKSRSTIIKLQRHTVEQVAEMIKQNYSKWELDDCLSVAQLCAIPRVALDFADKVVKACVRQGCDITKGIELTAERLGLDHGGLTTTAVEALKVLSQQDGLSKKALCAALAIEEEEFDKDVLPCLMATALHPPYVSVTNRHRITEEGREALRTRECPAS